MSGSKIRLEKPKLTKHPVDVGQRTEAVIVGELVRRGYRVLMPFGSNQRYDLVIDLNGRFLRAQCKTGRLRNGVIAFNTISVQCNTHRIVSRNYDGGADVFLVYCQAVDAVYCVPIEEATASPMKLRVVPTLNGQKRHIRWASDYELPA